MVLKLLRLNILLCTVMTFSQSPVTYSNNWLVTNKTTDKKLDFPNTIFYVSDNNSFSIYPNPTNSQFSVRFNSSLISSVNLDVIDAQGRTIDKIENLNQNNTVDTKDLSNGVYFLNIQDQDNKSLTIKKLIIHK